MTVTVVKGLLGKSGAEVTPSHNHSNQGNHFTSQQASTQLVHTNQVVSQEAVVSNLKANRLGSNEKVRDYKSAKELSDSVASKIREDKGSAELHGGLSSTSAREHFAR